MSGRVDDLVARLRKMAQRIGLLLSDPPKVPEDAALMFEAAEEIERLQEGLANIESGACIEEWGHKPEGQFQDYAAAILRGESPPVWETCPVCHGIGRDPEGDTCANCGGECRIIKPVLRAQP